MTTDTPVVPTAVPTEPTSVPPTVPSEPPVEVPASDTPAPEAPVTQTA